jgi:predicted RNase H-like nuclease
MGWVAGVDGFKSKWCVVLSNLDTGELKARIVPTFAGLLTLPEEPSTVCVDIPIGLPDHTPTGGRSCEREARAVLGPRASSVFSALGRAALKGSSRLEAHNLNREAGGVGIGAQAWGLSKKLREVDEAMTPERQRFVHEVHPEVSFWALNGSKPITYGKKSAEGARERVEVLVRGGFPREFVQQLPPGLKVGRDDFLDACVAAWTATRIATGTAGRMPVSAERDARGLDMAIWY